MVEGFKYTILMKDYELVGEDPVLTRELRRRMQGAVDARPGVALEGGALELLRKELFDQISDMSHGGSDNRTLNASRHESDARAAAVSRVDIDTGNRTNIGRQVDDDRRGRGHGRGRGGRRYEPHAAYVRQPDDSVVESFALQMIEQAIYSVQYRLNEAQHFIEKYEKDVRFRMGYILKQVEWWIHEMEVMYSYIGNDERKNLKKYNVNKNLIYYSHLVRKNFDITYTISHLLEIHTEFHAFVRKMQELGPGAVGAGFERPDHSEVDLNDPDNIAMFMDMTSDQQ